LVTSWCRKIASVIWLPIVCTGLSALIGSWKIIDASPPRTRNSRSSFSAKRGDVDRLLAGGAEA
jgi:hypothetical protein